MTAYKRKHTKRTAAKKALSKVTARDQIVKAAKKVPTPKRKVGRANKAKNATRIEAGESSSLLN